MPLVRGTKLFARMILASVTLLGAGGCGVSDSIDKVNATMEHAVETLDQQSSQWQVTLQNLETQLAKDARGLSTQLAADVNQLISHVHLVARDGVQFGQEALNCQTDIFGTRAKVAVQNLLINFLNQHRWKGRSDRPLVPLRPIVCSANPNEIDVRGWPGATQLVLSGVDLNLIDTRVPLLFIVRSGGLPDRPVQPFHINRLTNYRIAINVPNMISERLFDANSRQLVVRWEGQRVNSSEIPIVPMIACGALGQTCCHGSVCQGGNLCQGGTCVSPPCGGANQPCCAGAAQCTGADSSCVNDICTRATCSDTPFASIRSQSPWAACASNGVADGVQLRNLGGAFAISLHCCAPLFPNLSGLSRYQSPELTRESKDSARISNSGFLAKLRCRDTGCFGSQLEFVEHPRVILNRPTCQFIQQEPVGRTTCPAGQYVAGVSMDGAGRFRLYCCGLLILPGRTGR